MASEVDICNLALSRIGVSKAITSLDEASTEAKLCKRVYSLARDQMLSESPWPWAMKYAVLALVDESDETEAISAQPWRSEWQYVYQVPSDAVRCNRIVVEGGRGSTIRPEFRLFQGTGSALIATDQEDAIIEYVSKVTDPQRFPPLFASALAWKVAYEIAVAMSAKQSMQQQAFQAYIIEKTKAEANAYDQGQGDPYPDSEYIEGR